MSALTEARLRSVLAWIVIVLLAVPVGGALYLGVAKGESPCILCWAERTSMVLIALVGLFVVRYGPRPRYLGMVVLLGAWGTFMGLRHSALHLARDVGQGFSGSVLGAHTYVWAWVIHWLVLVVVAVLLLMLRGSLDGTGAREPDRAGRFAMGMLFVVALLNAVQAFASTGPPPFIGQGDPIRLSANPKRWVWMNEELQGPISWRGGWTIPKPDASTVDADPAHGPLTGIPTLLIERWEKIGAALDGTVTDFAVGADSTALVTTDDFRVYWLDASLATVRHWVQLDPGFSVDITTLAGAAFLNGDTVAALSNNKSYVLLRPDGNADGELEWRHFLGSSGDVSELRRSRFATVRARQQYVLSLGYDAQRNELITISVPSPRQQRVVVSRFARADLMLSSEFVPTIGPALKTAGEERGLAEYYVTGATVADGKLYAISAAYSTLLVIDLDAKAVVAAYALPDVKQPVGIAARGSELLIAQADGRIAVTQRPGAP